MAWIVELQQIHGTVTLIPHLCYKYMKNENNQAFTDILILFMVVLTMINFSSAAQFTFLFYPYNRVFQDSHPIHTCFAIAVSNASLVMSIICASVYLQILRLLNFDCNIIFHSFIVLHLM